MSKKKKTPLRGASAPPAYESPLATYEHEYHFARLRVAFTGRKPAIDSVRLLDIETGREADYVTPRAQTAVCIYCDKGVASWGAVPRGKKAGGQRRAPPAELHAIRSKHSFACAESWTWQTLARFALDDMSTEEQGIVKRWLVGVKEYGALVAARRGDWGATDSERAVQAIVSMFTRLPSRDIEIVQAIEFFVGTTARFIAGFDKTREPAFIHGATEEFPHVFFPTQLGDAEYGRWGMCPCGVIEFRGEMPLDHRLIGWGYTISGQPKSNGPHVAAQPHTRANTPMTTKILGATP